MNYKVFDWYTWLISSFGVFFLLILVETSQFFVGGFNDFSMVNSVFWCDGASFYFTLLSILLWFSFSFFITRLSKITVILICASVLFSIFCYSCVHALLFWFFYEMSILCLLLLLVLESPYSERYLASWYLMGYVVITSLPMLVCLFYFSIQQGSFGFCDWSLDDSDSVSVVLSIFLSILFMTKIPLAPFHVWLPIVHAEASSIVSVCLSGYIMKLGILGVFRICCWVLPDYVFSFIYCLFILIFSLSFFLSAAQELDGKRWLALLSLCHIIMPVICISVGLFDNIWVPFVYCLGHGVSAGVTFILLWVMYDLIGSRNWFLLKNCVSHGLMIRICSGACLCTVASLPPLLQFFCEVSIVCMGGVHSVLIILGILLFLFLGGLVPIFLLGSLMTRHYSIGFGLGVVHNGVYAIAFLILWSFILFLVV